MEVIEGMDMVGVQGEDPIAAIATALGEASVGIVRVSGLGTGDIVARVFRTAAGSLWVPGDHRTMSYGVVCHPDTGEEIDECILLWMPAPHSYTAEDVAELQVHGGIQLVQRILQVVLNSGARIAEPGEFTKRAFLNGRIDLSQAEAVMDLIRSKTELASRSALKQVKGQFGVVMRKLRKELLRLQAHVEVTIDYPEHDVESVAAKAVMETGQRIIEEVTSLIDEAAFGEILREGISTAIVGRPNVGKSSLLNHLLKRERAIVTDIPGTTRDVLEEYVNLQGIPFRIMDTAGIRETDDVVERIGVDRSREVMEACEFVILVLNSSEGVTVEDEVLLQATNHLPRIVVLNKVDLVDERTLAALKAQVGEEAGIVPTSLVHGQGLEDIMHRMVKVVDRDGARLADSTYLTTARQVQLLKEARSDLHLAVEAAESGATLDLVAVQLQSAYRALGLVIGEEAGEDLLEEIFSNFCLGK